ncbi:hypothetical protein [Labilibaculum sp.]|uniref:hypothetical protein n=1 Tax=Labilibaculum sp. TaxID=2060723 RepID=UPI00356A1FDC
MKKPIKNIIAILLLGFYLAGFCGIHLLSFNCSSCGFSDIQLTQNNFSLSAEKQSECCNLEQSQKDSLKTANCEKNTHCCDSELIYLKNNPKTTLAKENKAPLANESILFITQTIKLLRILAKSINPKPIANTFYQQTEPSLHMLCTYRC